MKVLLFINKCEKNPFVANLFNSLKCIDKIDVTQSDLLEIDFLKEFDIIHIHWPEVFHNWLKLTEAKLQEIIKIFDELKSVKIVYTKHNFKSHQLYNNENQQLYSFIEERANKIIHLTEQSLLLKPNKGVFIPHGTFGYLNVINEAKSRKLLGLKPDDFVILTFGKIRNYEEQKNIYKLYRAFKKINTKTKIIVPGWNQILKPSIKKSIFNRLYYEIWFLYVSSKMKIKSINFIKDDDIQIYFNASNIVFIPRKDSLNSGVFYLAMEFKKQVIGIECEFPGDYIKSYNQLLINVDKSIENQITKNFTFQKSVEYKSFTSWEEIGEMHYNLYIELMNKKKFVSY
jgi:beta-1,4-mannosyltransferase